MAHWNKSSTLTCPACRTGEVVLRVLPRLAGAARFFVGALKERQRTYKKALYASITHYLLPITCLLCLLSPAAWAATPPGTTLTNTATANYLIAGAPHSKTAAVAVITDATIEFLAPALGGTSTPVGESRCASSGSTDGPFDLSGGIAAGSVALAPATAYRSGQTVYIEMTDHSSNKNPGLAETVAVTITSDSALDDHEILLLTETGLDTGVFMGALKTTTASATLNDCALSVGINSKLSASYTYERDGSSTLLEVAATVLVDPYGVVFDAVNGLPVDGATVTLIKFSNGLPAEVFCDDASTRSPNPMVTGSTFTACGGTVVMPPGNYRFPLLELGNYVLRVEPPLGYTFPSTNTAPIGGFAVLGVPGAGASYGTQFPLPLGPPLHVDIPVDRLGGDLQITKSAGKSVVGAGEYVPYTLTIRNNDTVNAAADVRIEDRLPQGFRYQAGSTRLNGAVQLDPTILADGRTLTFALGNIPVAGTFTLKYVAQVTAGAQAGKAENAAAAISHTSNTARYTVIVREDLMRSRAILMGRVIIGSCDERADNDENGLQNARIVLEDGTYILTDKDGRWHADNIRPGTHVVQLDLDSLPADYEVVTCEENSRFAGRNYSQFVNVRGGSLWRADFHVQKKVAQEMPLAQAENPTLTLSQRERELLIPQPVDAADSTRLVEQLPYDADWLASAEPGTEWLHPQETFLPALPAIKVAVKRAPDQRATLKLNGEEVNPLYYYYGAKTNAARTVTLATWRGIHIKDGDNLLELIVTDASGNEVLRQSRNIRYTVSPDRVEFVPEHSRLIADGKTRPIIVVRFLDKDGYKMRRGINGEFQLNSPYQSAQRLDAIQRDPLAGNIGGQPRYEVGADGIALIELAPTTQSGVAVLKFKFNNDRTQELRAWLEAGQRDWILAGFAEGTLGHQQLSGNLSALQEAGADAQLFDGNRLAFYAKGTIKGEYLLTIAYDSAKRRGAAGSNLANLQQAIDPALYYTLYADATQPAFDAARIGKLYLKIERKQFYALFGDYDTGLTATEFSRYSRTVTGLKSEYKGVKSGYTAFATLTAQAYIKDEIPGDGTSGLYRLTRKNIVDNSDKIRLEVRDRFQSQIIVSAQTMTRYLDYEIDYLNGTLFFKQPVPARDAAFNPLVIVAEYESGDSRDENLTAGGRANFKPNDKLEIGATLVRDGTQGASGDLGGLDATWQLTDKTKVQAELAQSEREVSGIELEGSAWKAELTHQDGKFDAKAYIREQEGGFGLGQQAASESDTRKVGVELRLKISDTIQLQGQVYRQDTLGVVDARRDVLEARVNHNLGGLSAYYGARAAFDDDGLGVTSDSKQALAGVGYTLTGQKLTLRADTEISVGVAGSVDFPDRVKLGADYHLTAQTKLFVEQEFARGEQLATDMTRAGLRTQLWSGGEMAASLNNQAALDGGRMVGDLGLVQKWQINKFWQADFGINRAHTLSDSGAEPPPASGDYTAVSLGANYNHSVWGANSRIEWRTSDTDDKINFLLGARHNLDAGRVLASGLTYINTESANSQSRSFNLRLSYAHRPWDSAWIWLNRLDYTDERTSTSTDNHHGRKLVNNFNANWMPVRRTQVALQYGAKYVLDTIDSASYRGYTDLIGLELRHDLNRKWDIGSHASMLHTWSADVKHYGLGASLGYKLMDNIWIAAGYNLLGFDDADFSGAAYRSQGAYVALRVKFDQDTLKLNDHGWFARKPGPKE